VKLEEQSKAATERARATGEEKKQAVPSELLEEVFELNLQLQELKADPSDASVAAELASKKKEFETRLAGCDAELKGCWSAWDDAPDAPARERAKEQMIAILNRRSYIRNLVRDVNAALAGGQ